MAKHHSTVGKAWFVCTQYMNKPERFDSEEAARAFAESMARKHCGEHAVEIFTCTHNLRANVPVVEA